MKTITAFTISIVLLLLSALMLGFAFNTLTNANDILIDIETNKQVDQSSPYIVYGIIQSGIALLLLLKSISTFHTFLDYYKSYQEKKRDEEIKDSIKEAKYDKLYKDLNSTNVLEKREELITDFYTVNRAYTGKSNLMDLLQKTV